MSAGVLHRICRQSCDVSPRATYIPQSHISSFQHDVPTPINEDGQCVVAKELHTDDNKEGACTLKKK